MRYAVPVEHLLLLLRPYAIVLVHEIEERTLWFFEGGIGARFQIAQIRKYALLKLLGILHGPSEGLKSEREASDNVCSRDMKEIIPARR